MRNRPFAGEFDIITVPKGLLGQLKMTGRAPECITIERPSPVKHDVSVTQTTLHSGGIRFWLLCPRCSRRAVNLYAKRASKQLACRVCVQLVYKSQYCKSKNGVLTWLTGEWLKGTLHPCYESRLDSAMDWFNKKPRPKAAFAVADVLGFLGLPNVFKSYPKKPAP